MEIIDIRNNLINKLVKKLDKSLKIIKHISKIDNLIYKKLEGGSLSNIKYKPVSYNDIDINYSQKISNKCREIYDTINIDNTEFVSKARFFLALKRFPEIVEELKLPKWNENETGFQNSELSYQATFMFDQIDKDNDNKINWSEFQEYCNQNIYKSQHSIFNVPTIDQLLNKSEKYVNRVFNQDSEIELSDKLDSALKYTQQYLSNANQLVNVIKLKLDNGERFTKFECGLDSEGVPINSDFCQENALRNLAELNRSIQSLPTIETYAILSERHQKACQDGNNDIIIETERKLRELGYNNKC